MKPVFLFNRDEWDKKSIDVFLDALRIEYKLRYGFGHILAICSQPEIANIDDVNLDLMSHVRDKIPPNGILGVWHDVEKGAVSNKAIRINRENVSYVDMDDLLNKKNNIAFDLANFGFIPFGGAELEELYEAITLSAKLSDQTSLLKSTECRDIIRSLTVPDDVKKIVLDFFTLRASAILIASFLLDPNDIISQYSQVFLLSYITRAQFEKLILLLAKLDHSLDFEVLDKSKKMKSTFRKQAKKSNFDLTKRLSGILGDVELLDDNYRTPETHKMGRILGLVKKGYFGTLFNEVLSFQNTAKNLFRDICDHIRGQYIDSQD